MATTQKKPMPSPAKPAASAQAAHSAPKLAAQTLDKTTAAAYSAVESTRSSAESFAKMGADTVKELFANSTGEASKAHDKAFAMSREGAENLSRVVDALSRTLNDSVSLFRENADAAIEVMHITADITKTINSELVSNVNSNFVDNVELYKDAFACRNVNDVMDMQSKWLSTNLENFFAQSARLAEMSFQLVSEAAEPIHERVAEATERLSKSMAA